MTEATRQRERELAELAARAAHSRAMHARDGSAVLGGYAGHVFVAGPGLGFDTCPNPDCVLVREPLSALVREQEPQRSECCIVAAIITANGTVIRGQRHDQCFQIAASMGLKVTTSRHAQGFITSRNRYVEREEALKLQLAAGIASVSPGGYRGDQLYSQDLYIAAAEPAAALVRETPQQADLTDWKRVVELAHDEPLAMLRKHGYVFGRFPRDMEKQPPQGDGEKWEAMAFSLYTQLAAIDSLAQSVIEDESAALTTPPPSQSAQERKP